MKKIKNIVIFGTGAVAAEITSYLCDGNWGNNETCHLKGYVASDDAGINHWKEYQFEHPFLGNIFDYQIEPDDYFILALGNYKVKREIAELIKNNGGRFTSIIHPTAIIAKTAIIGEGNILSPYTMVGPNVKIGNFNLLTSQSIISHDTIVGDYNFFSTSILCGYNKIGNDNYFGVRATTIPNIVIGDRNTIQAGMIVDKNINDDTVIFHKYKEKIMILPKTE
jgi:sugar O-acyltransferase (sialic acid O-acetyltransferase NeuD family)